MKLAILPALALALAAPAFTQTSTGEAGYRAPIDWFNKYGAK